MIGCSIWKSRARSPVVVSSAVLSLNSTEMSWSAAVRAWTELLEHYRLMSLPFTESANHLCHCAKSHVACFKDFLGGGDGGPASHHIVIRHHSKQLWQYCQMLTMKRSWAEQHFLITALAFYFIFKNQSKTLECMEHWGEEGWWLFNSISLLDRSQYVQLCRSQYMCSVQHTMCTTGSSCSSRSHCCTSSTFTTTAILKCNRI